jgi:hypothetical protein
MSMATLTRISRRDLADAAVRTMRVAGVSHGEAKRAAVALDYLEVHRGTGIMTLAEMVDAGLDTMTIPGHIDVGPTGPHGIRVDAGGASSLLVVATLVDLLRLHTCDEPTVLWLASATQPSTLEAVIAATARSGMATVGAFVDHDRVGSISGSPTPDGPAVSLDRQPPAPLNQVGWEMLSEGATRSAAELSERCRSSLRAALDAERRATIHMASSSETVAVIATVAASASESPTEACRRAAAARSIEQRAWDEGLVVDAAAWDQVHNAATRWLVVDE